MPLNHKPVFANVLNNKQKTISVAKTTFGVEAAPADSTSFRELITAPTGGCVITRFQYQFIPTTGTPITAACLLNIWLTDTAGINAIVLKSIKVLATTAMTTTNPGACNTEFFEQFNLQAGQKIFVSVTALTANTECNVFLFGGNLEE